MLNTRVRHIGIAVLVALWAALTLFAWLRPANAVSEAERRELAQFPEPSGQSVLSGDFMENFESYSLDQFPLRDMFRQMKALFHYHALQQMDNNGIYVENGYAAELNYPLDTESVAHALKQMNTVYRLYLQKSDCRVYTTVVPDKGYYLAEANGYLAMDYETLFQTMKAKLPWATFVDITDSLGIDCYYRTDTHWRQEKIWPVAQKLAKAMGVSALVKDTLQMELVERPFYGVYYGQAALPMDPEPMYTLTGDILSQCSTYTMAWDTKQNRWVQNKLYDGVYDMEKLTSQDLYDIYLSGLEEPLVIENPNATTDKELVVFRDSYGSSLVPLLVGDYAKVTLVDIRAGSTPIQTLTMLDFEDQDVLFMYSALVLNGGYI